MKLDKGLYVYVFKLEFDRKVHVAIQRRERFCELQLFLYDMLIQPIPPMN